MTSRDQTPLLLAAIISTVSLMVYAASKGRVAMLVLPAALFVSVTVLAAVLSNIPDWNLSQDDTTPRDVELALYRNARIMGATYAWSALAMQGLYLTPLTGLKWQHGWQYAAVFGLLAIIAYEYARQLRYGPPAMRSTLVRLALPATIGQGLFAAGAMLFLVLSGKLLNRRPDWAAHQIFLFAALLVMVVAAVTLKTHARLSRS